MFDCGATINSLSAASLAVNSAYRRAACYSFHRRLDRAGPPARRGAHRPVCGPSEARPRPVRARRPCGPRIGPRQQTFTFRAR